LLLNHTKFEQSRSTPQPTHCYNLNPRLWSPQVPPPRRLGGMIQDRPLATSTVLLLFRVLRISDESACLIQMRTSPSPSGLSEAPQAKRAAQTLQYGQAGDPCQQHPCHLETTETRSHEREGKRKSKRKEKLRLQQQQQQQQREIQQVTFSKTDKSSRFAPCHSVLRPDRGSELPEGVRNPP
jgi:hypothetical protein